MSALEVIKQDAVGAAILADWIGDGGVPVSPNMAEARAAMCLNCPHHEPGRWWNIFFRDPIAKAIRRTLEFKNRMNLRLFDEDKFGMCLKCGCSPRLKVWVPIEHIAAHTPPEQVAEFPKDRCWIRSEIEALGGK